MRKTVNREHIEGYLFDFDLAVKTVQREDSQNYGKEFINGSVDIQTDEAGLNVITIHYTYVTPTTKTGAENKTYKALKAIIDSGKTVVLDGKENATKVSADTSIAVNDFYTEVNGEEALVTFERNEGGFISLLNKELKADEKQRKSFEIDVLLTNAKLIEKDEEKGISADYLALRGAAFNFRGDLIPVRMNCRKPSGIKYFESMEISTKEPLFTRVFGTIENQTIVKRTEIESAFGDPVVKEYTTNVREWLIDNCQAESYPIDDAEQGVTLDELKKATAAREVYLAEVKKKQEEYKASKKQATSATNKTEEKIKDGDFDF